MKLLYCIGGLTNSGGLERVLSTKVNYLADSVGYEVHIVVGEREAQPFFSLSPLVNLHYCGDCSKREYQQKLEKIITTIKPHITISMGGREQSFLYKIKDGSAKVLEFHFTKNYLVHLVRGIRRMKFRWLHLLKAYYIQFCNEQHSRHYDHVVLLTRQDLELWGNRENMSYIPNPLSFRSDKKSDLSHKQIIAVGRLISQKGFDMLIEAFNNISPRFKDWNLSIWGSGQDSTLLYSMIDQYNLSSQVKINAPVDNISHQMLKSSIFVFPSRYEGFGLVLTEAMECGLPCVAFDCECGPREIIKDNQNGLLVKVGDIEALSNTLSSLMDSDTMRREMGLQSIDIVRNFYCVNIMPQWVELFNKLIR